MAKQEVREECVIPMPINGSSLAGVSPEFRQLLEQMIASQSNPELRALLGHKLGATSVSNKWKGELESISRDLRSVLKSVADLAVTCIYEKHSFLELNECFHDEIRVLGTLAGQPILPMQKRQGRGNSSLQSSVNYNGQWMEIPALCEQLSTRLIDVLKRKMRLDWLVEQGSYQNSVSSIAAKFARGAKLSKTKKDILTFSHQWERLNQTLQAVIKLLSMVPLNSYPSSSAQVIQEKSEDPETYLLNHADDVLDTAKEFTKVFTNFKNFQAKSSIIVPAPGTTVISAPESANTDAWGGVIFCALMLPLLGKKMSRTPIGEKIKTVGYKVSDFLSHFAI